MSRIWHVLFGWVLVQTACSGSVPTTGTYSERGGNSAASPTVASGGGDTIDAAAGAAGLAGVAGVAGASGLSVVFGPIGLGCDATQPCSEQLHCYAAGGTDFSGFSPPGGYCSIACTRDADCAAIDPTALCVEWYVGGQQSPRICSPQCKLGDNAACGMRPDLACWSIDGTAGPSSVRACLPTCNDDSQCPDGTVCDVSVNLCATRVPTGGLALGATCDPQIAAQCGEGMCIELDTAGVCSAFCRRGTFPQCGGEGENTTCGWVTPGDEAAGDADIGMCASACACDAHCAQGTHCTLHPDRVGMKKPGICTVGTEVGISQCT